MARPKLDISEEQVEQLAAINCSYAEMAGVLDCDESTLTRRFAQAIKRGRESGKMSLKRAMWKKAVNDGNVTMMIWLSKQMLGYADKVENYNLNQSVVQMAEDMANLPKEELLAIIKTELESVSS